MDLLMKAAFTAGSVKSCAATVAILQKTEVHHQTQLMSLAIGVLSSGMMTLGATAPNIIVNNVLSSRG